MIIIILNGKNLIIKEAEGFFIRDNKLINNLNENFRILNNKSEVMIEKNDNDFIIPETTNLTIEINNDILKIYDNDNNITINNIHKFFIQLEKNALILEYRKKQVNYTMTIKNKSYNLTKLNNDIIINNINLYQRKFNIIKNKMSLQEID